MKSTFILLLKCSLVVSLISWLVYSGKLEWSSLWLFVQKPELTLATLFIWAFGSIMMNGLRWRALLEGMKIQISFIKVISLTLIGVFFNAVMPGAVGGDIIKAFYVYRDHKGESARTKALISILLDRVMGLYGMFSIASMMILLNWEDLIGQDPASAKQLMPLIFIVLGLFLGCTVFFTIVLFPIKDHKDPFAKLFQLKIPGFPLLHKLYSALVCYRTAPKAFFKAYSFALCFQFFYLFYFYYVGTVVLQAPINIGMFFSIVPIGMLIVALPLTPSGLGVGHVSFDHLFHIIGLQGGANVFHLVVVAQMVLNFLGVFPYLSYSHQKVTHVPNSINIQNPILADGKK